MSLVNYSSSSGDEGENDDKNVKPPAAKKQKTVSLLPNPLKLQIESQNAVENCGEYNGRKRSFPHERGIWATYVYIGCPLNDSIQKCQDELSSQLQSIDAFKSTKFHAEETPHMSLTRTIVLRHHWINEFIQSIEKNVSGLKSFKVPLNTIRVYCNEEFTRTFIGISIDNSDKIVKDQLIRIVQRLDVCLTDFKLQTFYENPSFHVTVLWCVGNQKLAIESHLKVLQNILDNLVSENYADFLMNVDKLNCKCGNKLYSLPIK